MALNAFFPQKPDRTQACVLLPQKTLKRRSKSGSLIDTGDRNSMLSHSIGSMHTYLTTIMPTNLQMSCAAMAVQHVIHCFGLSLAQLHIQVPCSSGHTTSFRELRNLRHQFHPDQQQQIIHASMPSIRDKGN